MSNTLETFLEHHGVKGMRWGVRKERKAIKENWATAAKEIGVRQQDRRMNSTLDSSSYSKLSDSDVVVSKGSTIKRTTKDAAADEGGKNLFVSTNKADALMYRGILPGAEGPKKKFKDEWYEKTYTATEDLKSPSEKKRVDAYIELMGQKSIETGTGEKIDGREYLRRAGLGDTVDTLSNKELALTYYGQLVVTQGIRDEPINTAYFNSLKAKGYNSLVDDNDRLVISKTPMMVFDSAKSLETTHVKQLTTQDVHDAQGTLKVPDLNERR